jgi:hypothetical protein
MYVIHAFLVSPVLSSFRLTRHISFRHPSVQFGLGREFGKSTLLQLRPSDYQRIADVQYVSFASTATAQFSNIRVTDGSPAALPLHLKSERPEIDADESDEKAESRPREYPFPVLKLRASNCKDDYLEHWAPNWSVPAAGDIYVSFQARSATEFSVCLSEDMLPRPARSYQLVFGQNGHSYRVCYGGGRTQSMNDQTQFGKLSPNEYGWYWVKFESKSKRVTIGTGTSFDSAANKLCSASIDDARLYAPRFVSFLGGPTQSVTEFQHLLVTNGAERDRHFKPLQNGALVDEVVDIDSAFPSMRATALSATSLGAQAWAEGQERPKGGVRLAGLATANAFQTQLISTSTVLLSIFDADGSVSTEMRFPLCKKAEQAVQAANQAAFVNEIPMGVLDDDEAVAAAVAAEEVADEEEEVCRVSA